MNATQAFMGIDCIMMCKNQLRRFWFFTANTYARHMQDNLA